MVWSKAEVAHLASELRGIGIARIEISFEGAGDDGQIEYNEILYTETAERVADGTILDKIDKDVPDHSPYRERIGRNMSPGHPGVITYRYLVTILAYDALESTLLGWEINDGSYGEVTFDTIFATISVQMNQRVTTVDSWRQDFESDPEPTTSSPDTSNELRARRARIGEDA